MPRLARNIIEEAKYYHIMVQGIGRDYVFDDDDWKGYYLRCMQEKSNTAEVKIIAFCIMGNHAHALLKAEKIDKLSKFMHLTNSAYSRYYNSINKRVGHVFRNRYRSEPIKNAIQLINCLVYIHNNPVKAGIVEKAEEYRYSSYINYLTQKGIVDFKEAAKLFDISPENVREIMKEESFNNWMEHDDKEYESKEDVLKELMKSFNINKGKLEDELLLKFAIEIHRRCGTSYREIAQFLGVGRERLRMLVLSR